MAETAVSRKAAPPGVHVAGPVEREPFLGGANADVIIREVQRCLRCDTILRAGTRGKTGVRVISRQLELGEMVSDLEVECKPWVAAVQDLPAVDD